MLLILMYHRVHGRGQSLDALETHLRYLADHHPIVLPGEALAKSELSVCLTFDDATADFFYCVFPLLQRLNIKALVAVPTQYIEHSSRIDRQQRLAAQQGAAMRGGYAVAGSPLCTWQELREMQSAGLVSCASHSHSHVDMTLPGADVEHELSQSARLLQTQLGTPPNTFVYPYGRSRRDVQQRTARHYRYSMRIGSAMNRNWDANDGLLYRVDAEHFWPHGGIWSFGDSIKFRLKYLANRVRGK
jgi:peptidoglycan/xylan/chitin deacetylase (PgdA/CDA1 family)